MSINHFRVNLFLLLNLFLTYSTPADVPSATAISRTMMHNVSLITEEPGSVGQLQDSLGIVTRVIVVIFLAFVFLEGQYIYLGETIQAICNPTNFSKTFNRPPI